MHQMVCPVNLGSPLTGVLTNMREVIKCSSERQNQFAYLSPYLKKPLRVFLHAFLEIHVFKDIVGLVVLCT